MNDSVQVETFPKLLEKPDRGHLSSSQAAYVFIASPHGPSETQPENQGPQRVFKSAFRST